MARVWKNNANSSLAAAIDATATIITVVSGTGDVFPVATGTDYFMLTLTDATNAIEIVKVVSRTAGSDIMTVIRAQEGTISRPWAAGSIVSLRLTASALIDYESHIYTNSVAHAASVISNTPSGNITATDVQGAINQLDASISSIADPTLTALAALDSVPGFVTQTGVDIFTKRTLSAGTGIGITNDDGVSGDPIIAISDPILLAFASLSPFDNSLPYFPTATTMSVTSFTNFAQNLLSSPDDVTARTTLGAQETLVDGVNIKTINGESLLGSGDLILQGFTNLYVYTASSTWTKPAGLKRVKVIVVGGGGGGAGGYSVGVNKFGGNGGGGGGVAIKVIEAASLGSTESVIVGVGGTGGTGSTNGVDGGTSSFGTHCSATGGSGAVTNASGYAVGGQGIGGDLNLDGGQGGFGIYGPTDGTNDYAIGGKGGDSLLGKGGIGVNLALSGIDGQYGGGGGGGGVTGNGGNGGDGIVIVEEYF